MKTLTVSLAAVIFLCAYLVFGQAAVQRPTNVNVTPTKTTLYAGETQSFVASVVGIDDQAVDWSVDEQDGGAITDLGLYTAPKIQGVYHIIASSKLKPEVKSIAIVTVLTYCDPVPGSLKP